MSQKEKLLNLLSDYQPHNTIEICEKVYGGSHLGLARVGARIYDLRQDGHFIEGKKDKTKRSIYWYLLKPSVSDVWEFGEQKEMFNEAVA